MTALSAARALESALSERPDAEAVVGRGGRLTYHGLDDFAARHLRALLAAGVRPGDRLGVSLGNDLAIVGLFHAVMRLGAIWVGINRALAPPEKAYLLSDSESAFFVGDADTVQQVRSVKDQHEVGRYLVVDSARDSEWAALLDADPPSLPAFPDPLVPAAIAYTSGTTGYPKGAVHSQHNLMAPGKVLVESRGYRPSLRKADSFALTILNLQVLSTLLVAQCGGTAIVMDRVDPVGIAEWIAAERASLWNGAPAMLYGLAASDEVDAGSLVTLREVWSGGSHCPAATASRFREKFGHRVYSAYGSTEVPTVVCIGPRGAPDADIDINSCGPPLPHLKVHILDDDGHPQPARSTGEICVGPTDDPSWAWLYRPMLSYWKNAKATGETMRDGLLHTGDVGFLDPNGYLYVTDRRQAVILRGGANVYPAEVERVINDFAGIAGSCVLGVPDDRLGARVIAVVEVDEDQDSEALDLDGLRTHCQANLARYKVPERFFVRPLPRNAMGKVIAPEVRRALGPVSLTGSPRRR